MTIYGLGHHHTFSVRNQPLPTPAQKHPCSFPCLVGGTAGQRDVMCTISTLEVAFATQGCRETAAQIGIMTHATVYSVYAVGFFSL